MSVVVVLTLGLVGIVLTPYITSLDRLILRTPTEAEIIKRKVNVVEGIDKVLSAVDDNTLHDVAVTPDGRFGIAVGQAGTVLTTQNGGADWTSSVLPAPHFGSLRDVAISLDGGLILGVGVGEAVLRSQDRGGNWSSIPLPGMAYGANDIAMTPDGAVAIVVGRNGTVLRSNDRGRTWKKPARFSISVEEDLRSVALGPEGLVAIAVGQETLFRNVGRG